MTHHTTPRHPIGVVAERTGLTADVIRVWERRYGVVTPARDEAGQRLYSDADVERLRLLRSATEAGRSIGRVAGLDPDALARIVRDDDLAQRRKAVAEGEAPAVVDVDRLLELAVRWDGRELEQSLRRLLSGLGFPDFAEHVAAPLLRRLGTAWEQGVAGPGQEHLASVVVRRVLESVRVGEGPGPVAVVATLSGERHEAGALIGAGLAEVAGWRVHYLGPDLPAEDLAAAARETGARAVMVSVVYAADPQAVMEGLHALRTRLPDPVLLFAGGSGARAVEDRLRRLGVRLPRTVAELRAASQATPATPEPPPAHPARTLLR